MAQPLQSVPLQSSISPTFWSELTKLKLHEFKLDDAPIPITHARYSASRRVKDRLKGSETGVDGTLDLADYSLRATTATNERLSSSSASATTSVSVPFLTGQLINYNTIESFKSVDKNALLKVAAEPIWNHIHRSSSSSAASGSSIPRKVTAADLNPLLVITFADLKKYKYYYWCAFPALLQKPAWEVVSDEWTNADAKLLDTIRSRGAVDGSSSLSDFCLAKPASSDSADLAFSASLSTARDFWQDVPNEQRTLIFSDPSSNLNALGWPARNVLHYLSRSQGVHELTIVAMRDGGDSARIVRVRLPAAESGASMGGAEVEEDMPPVVGWERNERGKLGARVADLGPMMDPKLLADQAVDLNLQLMRWRIMPSLDLERVKNTKCLLLGAGTLGCYVARTLMAWGVRHITLVDSSTVSFSNPVRQPLFEFVDSLNGGKPKAQAAAEALKRIYPGVNATGIQLSIPMPGHPIDRTGSSFEQARADVAQLESLIDEHDVVYLLMDSRESRWLPTVLGASRRKLVMNVALGFDTFLVMRHGVRAGDAASSQSAPQQSISGAFSGKLGCYYCNDIVAPMDSLTDRTLDQMCTVTRPGIASIASSTAVELMVAVLQHPQGASAPSSITTDDSNANTETGSPLGQVPHQIRGFLAQFHNMKITGQSYDRCTGCSDKIVNAYETDGFSFLLQAFDDASFLERVTGLDLMAQETEGVMESLEWSEDEEDNEAGI